jgi:uncharacterized protein
MSVWNDFEGHVADLHALRRIYPEAPGETSLAKEAAHIHPLYRPYIEASPFVVLSTLGPQGLDASPRGDAPGFVQVADDHTLLLPDRRGNHRLDSLKNVLHDPRVALLFMIPGVKETLRVNGMARISAAATLLERFVVDGKAPRSVLVIKVQKVFFQCGRALIRSQLWSTERPVLTQPLPTPGSILQALSAEGVDGQAYDAALPSRQAQTLY